jgi:hypothetical protein
MSELFGIMAEFKSAQHIYEAAGKVREAGYKAWDTYTPFPVHGLDAQMGLGRARGVPALCLLGGITGFSTGVFIAWYMNKFDYPLVVGGKPYFSLIYPFPVFYELTILFAAFGAFFGQFIFNLLPRHHHPVFNVEQFERASDNAFFVVIEARDPLFDEARTRALLERVGGFNITMVNK